MSSKEKGISVFENGSKGVSQGGVRQQESQKGKEENSAGLAIPIYGMQ